MTIIKIKCSWEQPKSWKDNPRITLLQDFNLVGVTVPSGFVSDGVTTPAVFRSIVAPMGKSLPAALVHDYLLTVQHPHRRYADKKFKEALLESGVSKPRAYLLYFAVSMYTRYKELLNHGKYGKR